MDYEGSKKYTWVFGIALGQGGSNLWILYAFKLVMVEDWGFGMTHGEGPSI